MKSEFVCQLCPAPPLPNIWTMNVEKKEPYLTFHCSERAGQRKKSPEGAVVSSRARGGKRVQGALGTVISCGTVPGWGVEPSPVTVETSLAEQWKGRAHWTEKAWREKKKKGTKMNQLQGDYQ